MRSDGKVLQLADGRRLGYEEAGAPDGAPVFYFHGVPSAGGEWRMWGDDDMLWRLGIRLVAVDRPGAGRSSFQPGRRLDDWPADVAALADALQLDRFSILGYSGGGPYALACARSLPGRVRGVALVSSPAPFDLPGALEGVAPGNARFLGLSRRRPLLFRLLYRQLSLLARVAPRRYLGMALAGFEGADREAFARPGVHGALFAARGTSRGQQVDSALAIGPWPFTPAEVSAPVRVWHGAEDRNVSLAMFDYLAANLPGADARLIPGEGHVSLVVNHAEEILAALVGGDAAGADGSLRIAAGGRRESRAAADGRQAPVGPGRWP